MKTAPIPERFWPKVDKTPGYGPWGDCWRWTAMVERMGYGRFRAWGYQPGAHIVSFVLAGGVLPKGNRPHDTCVLHRCDMRDCVNPTHLYLGTQQHNVDDRVARAHLQNWKRLRVRAPQKPTRKREKLTPELICAIRADLRPQSAIAADLGVAQATISNVKNRRSWQNPTYQGVFA